MSILVVGSVAFDSITTPFGQANEVLGGSATFFSAAASFFSKVNLVAVVGDDFDENLYSFLVKRNVDIAGLQKVSGKTFRWSGEYHGDMNEAQTLNTCLNVFENFSPSLPEKYKNLKYVCLANIDPTLQLKVLEQINKPKFTALDTMNFWIKTKYDILKTAISKVNLVIMNDKEAKTFTGKNNIFLAAKELQKIGPKIIIIKRGEYGSYLKAGNVDFILPAYPIENPIDPTGAGDSFAGGFMGYLAQKNKIDFSTLKKALLHGTIMASFNIESFSIEKLKTLKLSEIQKRYTTFVRLFKI